MILALAALQQNLKAVPRLVAVLEHHKDEKEPETCLLSACHDDLSDAEYDQKLRRIQETLEPHSGGASGKSARGVLETIRAYCTTLKTLNMSLRATQRDIVRLSHGLLQVLLGELQRHMAVLILLSEHVATLDMLCSFGVYACSGEERAAPRLNPQATDELIFTEIHAQLRGQMSSSWTRRARCCWTRRTRRPTTRAR